MFDATADANSKAFSVGRAFFGVATTASGVMQLVTWDFVRLVPQWPAWVPARSMWACAIGAILVVAGLAMLLGRTARTAGAVVGAMLLVMVLALCLPQLVAHPSIERAYLRGFMWTNPLKALALSGGAALISGRRREVPRVLLAAFLVVCGLQHFAYNDFVTALVPSWIPAQRFWAYFTGVALIGGGAGLLVPRATRLAATLSAGMVFLWVLLLHIPRAIAGPRHAFETAGVFEALALSAVALMLSVAQPVCNPLEAPGRGSAPSDTPPGPTIPKRS